MHPRAGAQSAGDSVGPSNFRGESRIFEVNKERTQGPAVASETMFEYLQRSADPGAIRRCEWFDLWLSYGRIWCTDELSRAACLC